MQADATLPLSQNVWRDLCHELDSYHLLQRSHVLSEVLESKKNAMQVVEYWMRDRQCASGTSEHALIDLLRACVDGIHGYVYATQPRATTMFCERHAMDVEFEIEWTMSLVSQWCSTHLHDALKNDRVQHQREYHASTWRGRVPTLADTLLLHTPLFDSSDITTDADETTMHITEPTMYHLKGLCLSSVLPAVHVLPALSNGNCFFDSITNALGMTDTPTVAHSATSLRRALAIHTLAHYNCTNTEIFSCNPLHLTQSSNDYWTMQCLEDNPEYYHTPHARTSSHSAPLSAREQSYVRHTGQDVPHKLLSCTGFVFRYMMIQFYMFMVKEMISEMAAAMTHHCTGNASSTLDAETCALLATSCSRRLMDICSVSRSNKTCASQDASTMDAPQFYARWMHFYTVTRPRYYTRAMRPDDKQGAEQELSNPTTAIAQYFVELEYDDAFISDLVQTYPSLSFFHIFMFRCTRMQQCLDLHFERGDYDRRHGAKATDANILPRALLLDRLVMQHTARLVFVLYPFFLKNIDEASPCFPNGTQNPTQLDEMSWLIPWSVMRAVSLVATVMPSAASWYLHTRTRDIQIRGANDSKTPALATKSQRARMTQLANAATPEVVAAYRDHVRACLRVQLKLRLAQMCQNRNMWADQHVLQMIQHQYPWLKLHIWDHRSLYTPIVSPWHTSTLTRTGSHSSAQLHESENSAYKHVLVGHMYMTDIDYTSSSDGAIDENDLVHVNLVLHGRHYELIALAHASYPSRLAMCHNTTIPTIDELYNIHDAEDDAMQMDANATTQTFIVALNSHMYHALTATTRAAFKLEIHPLCTI